MVFRPSSAPMLKALHISDVVSVYVAMALDASNFACTDIVSAITTHSFFHSSTSFKCFLIMSNDSDIPYHISGKAS